MTEVWLELRWNAGGQSLPLARVDNRLILRWVKRYILAERKVMAIKARKVDRVLAVEEEVEFEKLRKTLELLLPEDERDRALMRMLEESEELVERWDSSGEENGQGQNEP